MMEQLERKRTQSEVPTVHGSISKPDEKRLDLKTCVSEPGEEILVKSLKSKLWRRGWEDGIQRESVSDREEEEDHDGEESGN